MGFEIAVFVTFWLFYLEDLFDKPQSRDEAEVEASGENVSSQSVPLVSKRQTD